MGKIDRAKYRSILEKSLFQSTRDLRLGWEFNFHEYDPKNDPKNTIEATLVCFKANLKALQWPSQDLNLTENQWLDLKM